MTYSYKDIKDKSKTGMDAELAEGIALIAAHFKTQHGMPIEVFQELNKEWLNNRAMAWIFYMDFRNKHPLMFK